MDSELIANIKSLSLDMINQAGSGHPGIVLSSAPILYTLYSNHLNIIPSNPEWFARDRFIMSSGHGSALLYATLFMCGYNITKQDLMEFRQLDSKTPGHPEYGMTPGVECSTGPLGQGIATSIGIALGSKILKSKYPFHHFNTYVLVGDGDLMEGISYEACSLAGTLNLDNLIVIYDSNNMTLDGSTDMSFKENVRDRFKALGFKTYLVSDGNNLDELNSTINKAKKINKPSFIEVKTIIGQGSLLENTNKVHGSLLSEQDLFQLKEKLKISQEPFYVNEELREQLINKINDRVMPLYEQSATECSDYVNRYLKGNTKKIKCLFRYSTYDILNYRWELPYKEEATRITNQRVMNELEKFIPMLIGGSADLNSSTKTYLSNANDITRDNYDGKNIWFGVREHAMGAILNGLALLKFRSFGSTFLSFSDYQKPAIRMSALMKLPIIYIYTHDSIMVGQDGPTHQPVEQLAMLRSVPNLAVYRPCDAKELVGCWQMILSTKNHPSALILSRSDVKQQATTSMTKTLSGGYILSDCDGIDCILMATGSEVEVALRLKYELRDYGIRVVSIPCKEQFLKQKKEYKYNVLPKNIKKIVIEASIPYGWYDLADYVIGVEDYGVSASEKDVLHKLKYDYNAIREKVLDILNH